MILIIDNYDSFTYNIAQYVGCITDKIDVIKNDLISIKKIEEASYTHIFISPGPGEPSESGKCIQIIKRFYKKIPILGICLGHQAIGRAFGAIIKKNNLIMHGKVSNIYNDGKSKLYNNVPSPFEATRYHSLIISKISLNPKFKINAWLKDGTIMGIKHKGYSLYGVQYHPESIKTEYGKLIIKNFLECV